MPLSDSMRYSKQTGIGIFSEKIPEAIFPGRTHTEHVSAAGSCRKAEDRLPPPRPPYLEHSLLSCPRDTEQDELGWQVPGTLVSARAACSGLSVSDMCLSRLSSHYICSHVGNQTEFSGSVTYPGQRAHNHTGRSVTCPGQSAHQLSSRSDTYLPRAVCPQKSRLTKLPRAARPSIQTAAKLPRADSECFHSVNARHSLS